VLAGTAAFSGVPVDVVRRAVPPAAV